MQADQQRCDAAKEHLDGLVKTLNTVRAGVEHLADKLQHISLVKTTIIRKQCCRTASPMVSLISNV